VVKSGLESKNTSLNQIPTGIKRLVDWGMGRVGGINLDYGGGKYEKSTIYLAKQGIRNLIYDPGHYNEKHCKDILDSCSLNGGADSATMLNVLNVIPTKEERLEAISNMLKHMHRNAKAIVGVYEKRKDGAQEYSGRGWQNNQPLSFYEEEIRQNFPNVKIYKKESFLVLSFK
jgi:hypothetical protein